MSAIVACLCAAHFPGKPGDVRKTRIGVTDYFENRSKNKDKGLINDGIAPFMSNIDGRMYDLDATVPEYT